MRSFSNCRESRNRSSVWPSLGAKFVDKGKVFGVTSSSADTIESWSHNTFNKIWTRIKNFRNFAAISFFFRELFFSVDPLSTSKSDWSNEHLNEMNALSSLSLSRSLSSFHKHTLFLFVTYSLKQCPASTWAKCSHNIFIHVQEPWYRWINKWIKCETIVLRMTFSWSTFDCESLSMTWENC